MKGGFLNFKSQYMCKNEWRENILHFNNSICCINIQYWLNLFGII